MEKEEVLHTDSDGHKVILHIELDDAGREKNSWVTYGRYPKVRYDYLTAEGAAKRILSGREITHCYVDALTIDALDTAEQDLKTFQFLLNGSIEIDGRKRQGPALKQAVLCARCIIGRINLSGLILRGGAHFSSASFVSDADFSFASFVGDAYFSSATFRGNTDFGSADFAGDANFSSATFGGDGDFRHARFSRDADFRYARFSREGDFLSASFAGHADFMQARFRGCAYFGETTFAGCAYFTAARFAWDAGFDSASFGGDAHFDSASFRGDAYFCWATFRGNAYSREATFAGCANFMGATFGTNAHFDSARFGWDAGFNSARFGGSTFFEKAILLSLDLRGARFEELCDMRDAGVGDIDLGGAVFTKSVLLSSLQDEKQLQDRQKAIGKSLKKQDQKYGITEKLHLLRDWRESKRGIYSVSFENTLVQGELVCDFKDLRPSKSGLPVIKPHRDGKWEEGQKQYAWLKEQFRKRGAYRDEDAAHWWASECARMDTKTYRPVFAPIIVIITALLSNLWLATAIHAWGESHHRAVVQGLVDAGPLIVCVIFAAILYGFPRSGKWVVNKLVFGYGVRLKNLIITILIVIFACSVLFCCASPEKLIIKCKPPPFVWGYLSSLYFSVITFATVGYGDVRAEGWAAGLAMVEGLLGIALNAALVVVIFRKLIR